MTDENYKSNTPENDNLIINKDKVFNFEQAYKTNKYKTRIVESEINSSLFFQKLLYYNTYYSIICFAFQIFSLSYKLWVFRINNFSVIRLILIIFWGIIEIYRLNIGKSANIQEFFPSLISFDLITIIFCIAPHIVTVIGPHILPIDISTVIIYFIFLIFELITSLSTMKKIINRKTALYYLRNTTTLIKKNHSNNIKSCEEIAKEVEEYLKDTNEIHEKEGTNYDTKNFAEKKYLLSSNAIIINKLKNK